MSAASLFSARKIRQLAGVLGLLMGLTALLPSQAEPTSRKPSSHSKSHAGKSGSKHKPAKNVQNRRPGKAHVVPLAIDSYADRSDARQWAEEAASRLSLPTDWMQAQIAKARRIPLIEQLVLPAPSPAAKNWAAYRSRFIEPRRVEAGAAFWQRHRTTLERAEQTYGVPAAVIVGILGVETLYGQHMGTFRVVDALATLAFDFPSAHPRAAERQAFFRGELEQFLRLNQRAGTDPLSIRGSYAGAMGMPQFMPSSWNHYAVDFDGDGRIDLFNSTADAIGSVANYFKAFGWKFGLPTHYPVTLSPGQTEIDALLAPDILPTFSVSSFTAKGAQLEGAALQHEGPLALIELRNGEATPSYVAGTENFYVVTRYNWSSYYAMAVIELGQAVAERVNSAR